MGSKLKKGLWMSVMSKFKTAPLATKIVAGVVSLGVVFGVGFGIGQVVKTINGTGQGNIIKNTSTAPQNREWEELLGKTKDEVVDMLGEPDVEDADNNQLYYGVYYNKDDVVLSPLRVVFHEDDTVSMVSCEEDDYSVQGVRKGHTLAQVKSIFDNISEATLAEENVDCGVLSAIFYNIGDYMYQFLYDEEEVVDHFAVSLIRHETIVVGNDTEPEDETQADSKEEQQNPQEQQKPQEQASGSEGKEKTKDIYKEYFLKNLEGENAQVFFADLTHDGNQDMIVVYGDDLEGYIDVYSIEGETVKLVYGEFAATMTNSQYAYGLYEEDGKEYLLKYAFFQRQGFPWYFYKIYSLTQDGEEVEFKGKSIEFAINEDGSYEGTTEEEITQLNQETESYALKSKLLLSGTGYYGIDNPSLDMMYGSGETFNETKPSGQTISIDKLMLTDEETIINKLGTPKKNQASYWKMNYDGLEVLSNYGGIDTFKITGPGYSVHGVFVGQSRAQVEEALKDAKSISINGNTLYIFRDESINSSFEFAVVPSYSGGIVSEIYYNVYFSE